MTDIMETNRVWILNTIADCNHLKAITGNGIYSFKTENAVISAGDIVYIYSIYLEKIRFKTIVMSKDQHKHNVILSIQSIYRGNALNIIKDLNIRPIHNLLYEITDRPETLQFIEAKFALDIYEQSQKQLNTQNKIIESKSGKPTTNSNDSKMPIGLVITIICIAAILIGLIVLIQCLFDGSIIFAICAFIGLCGMVGRELFK